MENLKVKTKFAMKNLGVAHS